MVKQSEALFIQSKMNTEETMRTIDVNLGPFDPWEINFYYNRLKNDTGVIINSFQKQTL